MVAKCFLKKGGERGAGEREQEGERRECHRAGKVQGYSPKHCGRIPKKRSQAKLCCETTMCVRKGQRERVRAGGGVRAGEGWGGGGVEWGEGRGRGEGGGASAGLLGGRGSQRAVPGCSRRLPRRLLHARPPGRPPRPASDPAEGGGCCWLPLPRAQGDRNELLKNPKR